MYIQECRIFQDFSSSPAQEGTIALPDWKEQVSNYLMRTWSIAFGPSDGALGRVHEATKRALAFIVGLALLPLTLTGMALRACSNSHKITFEAKQSFSETNTQTVEVKRDEKLSPDEEEYATAEEEGYETPNEEWEIPNSEPFLALSHETVLKQVEAFTEGYPQRSAVKGLLQRLLCPLGSELQTEVKEEGDQLAISIQTNQAPWAKFKSPKSRVPYNFHLQPQDGRYTFTIVKEAQNLVLNLNRSLILKKVDEERLDAIVKSYPNVIFYSAKAVGIDLTDETSTNLERSGKILIFQSLTFLQEDKTLIQATLGPLSEEDQANQNLIRDNLNRKIGAHGEAMRRCARSAIAFGEMLIGGCSAPNLRKGGDAATILKFFNPVEEGTKGEGRDAGRLEWFEGDKRIICAPF